MKKILYYVEPWAEISSDLRLGAFKDAVFQFDQLTNHAPDLDCRFLIGENLRDILCDENYNFHDRYQTAVLHIADLKSVYSDYKVAAHHMMTTAKDRTDLKLLAELSSNALGDFKPDVIIMHETHAPFLRIAFPDALILHSMYGMTYRMPYPQLTLFDSEGLYQNSILAKSADKIKSFDISAEDKNLLGLIRNWFASQIIPHDPTWKIIEPFQSRYKRLILVPLQVNDYFAFDECSSYSNQAEFLEDVLAKVPLEWGVIVTEHSEYKPSLNHLDVKRLKRLHPNLIYLDTINKIPYASQALLAHVDALITVSSSLAFQSLIYDCVVVSAGSSHINSVATCGLEDLNQCFEIHKKGSRDNVLHFLLTRYHHLTKKNIHDGAGLYKLLSNFHGSFKKGLTGIDVLPNENLSDVFEQIKKVSQWRDWTNKLNSLEIKVDNHPVLSRIVFNDAISFDLFDTLVERPFIEPHELFQFMEPMVRELTGNIYFPFHHLRREAERLARNLNGHRVEVTLDEIYAQLKILTSFPEYLLDEIKDFEIQVELALLSPRRGLVRSWRMAGVWGKKRSILTDIYLEEDFIRSLLSRFELDDFDLLYVSATQKIRKEDGSVYPNYLSKIRDLDFNVCSYLHIGDNPRADGEMARKFGIETVVIPKALDQLRRTEIGNLFQKALIAPSYDTSIYLGLIANRFFSAPTSSFKANSLCDGNLFNIGYSLLGPFILGYVQWVIRRMQAHKIDHAYFLARDGYLVMKVYEAIKKITPNIPNYSYLYCSRRSVMVPGIRNEKDIFEIATLNYGTTTVQNFLSSRYGLNIEDIPHAILLKHRIKNDGSTIIGYPRDLALTIRLVSDLKELIFARANHERKAYVDYLRQEGACDPKKRKAFVDIGYSGTMQRKVSEMTGQKYNGYYMLTHNYVLHHFRDQVFEAWMEEYDSQRSPYKHSFNNYIPLIESLLSSSEGSLICFNEQEGKLAPDFLYASNERERCAFLAGVHSGAMSFVEDYLNLFGKFSSSFEFTPLVASHMLLQFSAKPNLSDVEVFEGLILENLFAGSEFSVISNPKKLFNSKGNLTISAIEHLINESKWKEGAEVAYSKYLSKQDIKSHTSATQVDSKKNDEKDTLKYSKGNDYDKKSRLVRKLKNNPEKFFSDSKFIAIRPLRFLFGKNQIGQFFSSVIRRLV